MWKRREKRESFFALEDINYEVNIGDVVGIVGPNGAGKSTLLKLLSRITFPTRGRIVINGTLSSMLEVGTGFHPELTGRENIFLNGAIMGMRREEVDRKLDDIVAFSGIEEFLDTPVKHYSSGMYVRLAFSVASHLEPDILLIDEVLAVGDHEFRKKCLDKMLDVSGQGRTILMVSHQMSYLKALCSRGIYLNEGKIIYQGPIEDVINMYVNDVQTLQHQPLLERKDRRGSGQIKIASISILDAGEQPVPIVIAGQEVIFRTTLVSDRPASDVEVRLEYSDLYGHVWFISKNSISGSSIEMTAGQISLDCRFKRFPLNKNLYTINAAVYVRNELSDEVNRAITFEVEQGLFYGTGKLPPPAKGMLVEYDWEVKDT